MSRAEDRALTKTPSSASATPTAAPAADQPTSLSLPPLHPSPTLLAPYPPGAYFLYHQHQPCFDQLLVEVHPVRQEHSGKCARVLVVAVSLDGDFFPESGVRGGMLGSPKTSPPYQFFKLELF